MAPFTVLTRSPCDIPRLIPILTPDRRLQWALAFRVRRIPTRPLHLCRYLVKAMILLFAEQTGALIGLVTLTFRRVWF